MLKYMLYTLISIFFNLKEAPLSFPPFFSWFISTTLFYYRSGRVCVLSASSHGFTVSIELKDFMLHWKTNPQWVKMRSELKMFRKCLGSRGLKTTTFVLKLKITGRRLISQRCRWFQSFISVHTGSRGSDSHSLTGPLGLSQRNFSLEICDKMVQCAADRFCIWTTAGQLKQYPWEYMFITQPGEGHSKKDCGYE